MFVQNCTNIIPVIGREFVARVRRLARKRGVEVRFASHRAKGSHGTLYYGRAFTRVKDRKAEIGKGLLAKMLDAPGIDPKDFSRGRP